MEAVRIVNRARTAGRNVAEFVGQGDLLTGGDSISANGKDFLALMFQNVENWTKPAGRDRIARALTFYVEEALKTSSGADLLGQTTSPADILKKARDKQYGQDAESGDLVAGNRPEPSVPAPGAGGTGRQPEAATPEPGPQGEPASGATEADLTDYPTPTATGGMACPRRTVTHFYSRSSRDRPDGSAQGMQAHHGMG